MPRAGVVAALVAAASWSGASEVERLVQIRRGDSSTFGIAVSNDNVIGSLRGIAADDGLLRTGERVLEVDGEILGDTRLTEWIRSHPSDTYTLRIAPAPPPSLTPEPPPSLGQMVGELLRNPQMRGMVSKMAATVVTGGDGGAGGLGQAMLGAAPEKLMLGGGGAADGDAAAAAAVAARRQQQQELETVFDSMLQSEAFGGMIEKVANSDGLQNLVNDISDGEICADVPPHALASCLLSEGGLLRHASAAACEALGADASECAAAEAEAAAMLHRMAGAPGGGSLVGGGACLSTVSSAKCSGLCSRKRPQECLARARPLQWPRGA